MSTTFAEERDALLPRKGVIVIEETEDHPEGLQLKLPRLNMKRTLHLSQLVDRIAQDEKMRTELEFLIGRMTQGNADGEQDVIGMVTAVNHALAVLDFDMVKEFFVIVTGKSEEWLDRNLEPGWGIQAVRVAFQQQGFSNIFSRVAGGTVAGDAGAEDMGKSQNVVYPPQSILSSQSMDGQTTPFSN